MATKTETTSSGVGGLSILFFIFLVLKLTHYIDWSWWWVTAPIWMIPVLIIAGFIIYIAFSFVLSHKNK